MHKTWGLVQTTKRAPRIPGLVAELTDAGRNNVYVRRRLESPMRVNDAKRMLMLADLHGKYAAFGWLWQADQAYARMMPIIKSMSGMLDSILHQTAVAPRVFIPTGAGDDGSP